jgi:hypothetical protein
MLIDDEKTPKIKNNRATLSSNKNLLNIIFDFCEINDIINLSSASKKFYEITKDFDYKFEEAIEKNYFSNYTNYE